MYTITYSSEIKEVKVVGEYKDKVAILSEDSITITDKNCLFKTKEEAVLYEIENLTKQKISLDKRMNNLFEMIKNRDKNVKGPNL